jgi:hypothetical protein
MQRTFEGNQMTATAIATTNTQPASNPLALIQVALQNGADPAQLEKLMELQERYERNQAAAAFGAAIAKFQSLCPRVHKSRKPISGPSYQYASFDDVMLQASPHLHTCGIALSFSTEANDRGIRVTCRVRVGIHAEDYTLDVPIPDMKMNNTQRYGAALSYAKRYSLTAALNIVCTDDVDDDGGSCFDPISEQQEVELIELIEAKGADKPRFLKWMGVEKLSDIAASDFDKAVTALRSKK